MQQKPTLIKRWLYKLLNVADYLGLEPGFLRADLRFLLIIYIGVSVYLYFMLLFCLKLKKVFNRRWVQNLFQRIAFTPITIFMN